MPTRDTAPIGAPCWVDLMTSDVARCRAFYSELFGWVAEEPNEQFGGYFNFSKNGVKVAGGMPAEPAAGPANVWSVYLATDDAAKTLEVSTANGATILLDAIQVADLGTMAVVADPGGAAIGLWQPGTHKGFGLIAEAGAPGWFELHTRDYDRAVAFYRDVFGWNTHIESDSADFRYTTARDGEQMVAGVMDDTGHVPDDVPAHWAVYFGTDDTDASLAKLVELGGSIVMPAEDTPYGRLAVATDPMGATFHLVAPNAQMPAREPSA
jgi:uncharacterized protein